METKLVRNSVIGLGVAGLMVAGTAHADERQNEIFVGTYAIAVTYDDSRFGDDELSGSHVGYARNFTDNFGMRASYFSTEHDDFSSIDASGYDLAIVGGQLSRGFNVWGGFGYYSEEWEADFGGSEGFSGAQFQFGIGYSWEPVSIRLVVYSRDASDYQDFVNETNSTYYEVNAFAASSSLNLGFRF